VLIYQERIRITNVSLAAVKAKRFLTWKLSACNAILNVKHAMGNRLSSAQLALVIIITLLKEITAKVKDVLILLFMLITY